MRTYYTVCCGVPRAFEGALQISNGHSRTILVVQVLFGQVLCQYLPAKTTHLWIDDVPGTAVGNTRVQKSCRRMRVSDTHRVFNHVFMGFGLAVVLSPMYANTCRT